MEQKKPFEQETQQTPEEQFLQTAESYQLPNSHLRFLALFVAPLLSEVPTPEDLRLALDVDGEENEDELHFHVEYKDFSPIAIIEIPEAHQFTALDCLDEKKQREFLGTLAKNAQRVLQNDEIAAVEKGKLNSKTSFEDKKVALTKIIESLLQMAGQ